jgi:hypothetical protein
MVVMNSVDGLFHLLNFAAPALAVGFLLALFGAGVRRPAWSGRLLRQTMINFGVNGLVLLAGLWWFGRDGKMATYAVMVLACASCQILSQRVSGAK